MIRKILAATAALMMGLVGFVAVAPAASASRITTLHPRTYNDARAIGEQFRSGTPVIMNLTEMDDGDAKRIVTLLKLLLAMAIDKYGYVPNRYANPSSGRIVQAVEKIRLKCDDGTVSGYLKMAVEEHWTEPE